VRSARLKRLIDLVGASVGLIVLALPIAVVAALVAARIGRPVLFRQRRAGRHGRPFTILKFRSMNVKLDDDGRPLPDKDRLSGFGRLLRSTSIDELPELINVLRGEMGLVGPRPLLIEYLPVYSPYEARRHEVRPGLTGWAQINGRNTSSWQEKFALDVWYVDHRSIRLDLTILLRTVTQVLRREGVSASAHATMPRLDELRRPQP